MAKQDIFEELISSAMSFDADTVMDAARRKLNQGIDPISIIKVANMAKKASE